MLNDSCSRSSILPTVWIKQPSQHACSCGAQVRTRTNRSGGVQGGLSNGEDIVIRIAFKPTSTIGILQKTVRGQVLIAPVVSKCAWCLGGKLVLIEIAAGLIGTLCSMERGCGGVWQKYAAKEGYVGSTVVLL